LLNLELLLTRIFSVTMWYHFAFMAISLAMFGVVGGAVLVGLRAPVDSTAALAQNGIRFSPTSALRLILIPSFPSAPTLSLFFAAITFLLTAIPFLFAGIVICIALTSFPRSTGSIYAADLAGSAAGCLLFVPLLKLLDAPSAVILNSAIAGFAALMFL